MLAGCGKVYYDKVYFTSLASSRGLAHHVEGGAVELRVAEHAAPLAPHHVVSIAEARDQRSAWTREACSTLLSMDNNNQILCRSFAFTILYSTVAACAAAFSLIGGRAGGGARLILQTESNLLYCTPTYYKYNGNRMLTYQYHTRCHNR